jgi:hypothetical protein
VRKEKEFLYPVLATTVLSIPEYVSIPNKAQHLSKSVITVSPRSGPPGARGIVGTLTMMERLPVVVGLVSLASRAVTAHDCDSAPPAAPSNLICTEPAVLQVRDVVIAVILIFLSGLFSGLNLGLMSFTDEDLRVIIEGASDERDVQYAERIRPLRKRGNLLLCTLLLGNTLVNAYLAILLDAISTTLFGPGIIGVIATTFFIVVFGEIIPQSVCSRHGLRVGSLAVPIVWVFVVICMPVALPIAKILDKVLGREIAGILSRQMLLEVVNIK